MHCWFCGEETNDGIAIRNSRICPTCENYIVQLDVDHPAYDDVVEKIKRLWYEILCSDSP